MKKLTLLFLILSAATTVEASVVNELLSQYKREGAGEFSINAGKNAWFKEVRSSEDGSLRNCTSCHTKDLSQKGKHKKTNKVIDPIAPSVNSERLSSKKKIKKWFKRNCKWTYGRECTAQEKGDFLVFIQSQ